MLTSYIRGPQNNGGDCVFRSGGWLTAVITPSHAVLKLTSPPSYDGHRTAVRTHSEDVDENTDILSKIVVSSFVELLCYDMVVISYTEYYCMNCMNKMSLLCSTFWNKYLAAK